MAEATGKGAAEPKGKKRLSKAAKRKSKRAVDEEAEDEAAETPATDDPLNAPRVGTVGDVAAAVGGDKRRRRGEARAEEVDEENEPRGVIYIGHIPTGFFEPQMEKFFGQFGKVTRLRVARSKKNAASKGYAFVEFEQESVAKIVAETMQKYLLFEKTLVCHVVPKEKQHPALFRGIGKRMRNLGRTRNRSAQIQYNERPSVEVDGEKIPQTTTRQLERRKRSATKLQGKLKLLEVELGGDAEDDEADGEPAVTGGKKRRRAGSGASRAGAGEALEDPPDRPAKKNKKKQCGA